MTLPSRKKLAATGTTVRGVAVLLSLIYFLVLVFAMASGHRIFPLRPSDPRGLAPLLAGCLLLLSGAFDLYFSRELAQIENESRAEGRRTSLFQTSDRPVTEQKYLRSGQRSLVFSLIWFVLARTRSG